MAGSAPWTPPWDRAVLVEVEARTLLAAVSGGQVQVLRQVAKGPIVSDEDGVHLDVDGLRPDEIAVLEAEMEELMERSTR